MSDEATFGAGAFERALVYEGSAHAGQGLPVAGVDGLRHQVLHRTVSALRGAHRYKAHHAAMRMHALDPATVSLGDYQAFASAIGVSGVDADAASSAVKLHDVSPRLALGSDEPASSKVAA